MKKRVILLSALCAVLVLGVSACGEKETDTQAASSAITNENQQEASTDDASNESDEESANTSSSQQDEQESDSDDTDTSSGDVAEEEDGNQSSDVNESASDFSENADSMQNVFKALYAASSYGSYSASNSEYFWSAITSLMCQTAEYSPAADISGSEVGLPKDLVKELANALFADFDANSESLPKLSKAVANEVGITKKGDMYYVSRGGDAPEYKLKKCKEQSDGSWKVTFLVNGSKHTATVKVSTYTGSGKPSYEYMVSSYQ